MLFPVSQVTVEDDELPFIQGPRDDTVIQRVLCDFTQETSHGGAGLLCPSYFTPIASRQVLVTALVRLPCGDSPFVLVLPPWEPVTARWLARFVAACCPGRVQRSTQLLTDLARSSIAW